MLSWFHFSPPSGSHKSDLAGFVTSSSPVPLTRRGSHAEKRLPLAWCGNHMSSMTMTRQKNLHSLEYHMYVTRQKKRLSTPASTGLPVSRSDYQKLAKTGLPVHCTG
ncbi:hypothetical protein TNCV_3847111 [Trichonephila clavipes]|nr:hypothetical protein TNCV_3847111 [Trichonephila clavipes]